MSSPSVEAPAGTRTLTFAQAVNEALSEELERDARRAELVVAGGAALVLLFRARESTKDVDAYFINSSAFEASDRDKVHVIARYAKDDVLRSGWLRGEDRIKDRIALAEIGMGKGRIVLFAFRPQHRGQTWGTFPFIWNAINEFGGRN